jgi:hypothetical protein
MLSPEELSAAKRRHFSEIRCIPPVQRVDSIARPCVRGRKNKNIFLSIVPD